VGYRLYLSPSTLWKYIVARYRARISDRYRGRSPAERRAKLMAKGKKKQMDKKEKGKKKGMAY